ncbi:MAG TPA: LamG-like jellyroll fold domain-containing protein [Puia sp.]
MKNNFTLILLGVVLLFSLSVSAQTNTAIKLNGGTSGAYLTTTSPILPITVTAYYTVELWAYVDVMESGQHYFVFQGYETNNPFAIGYEGDVPGSGAGHITIGETTDFTGTVYDTGIPMPVGQWVHIAVAVDVNGFSATLYINGVQQGAPYPAYFSVGGNQPLQIGGQYPLSGTAPIELANGRIDELRVWGDDSDPVGLRTATQIRGSLFGVDPASPGLIAYYNMNETSPTNTIFNTSTSPSAIPPNISNGIWAAGADWENSPLQNTSDNAISLNGGTDAVNIPNTTGLYDMASGGTIEMWIFPTSLGTKNVLIDNRQDATTSNVRYSYYISSSDFSLSTGTGPDASFTYNTTPLKNAWSRLAFVYNGVDATAVYLNGTLIGTLSGTLGTGSDQPVTIGNDQAGNAFKGTIDEVRFWNSPLDVTQIQANLNTPLTGNESGLIGLFDFNEGAPGSDNSGLRTVFDNTASTNDGAVSASMAMNSPTVSNFILSTITPLPVNFTSFTATAQEGQALLQWQTAQEQNSRDYSIERSADGKNYSPIGIVAAAGNSSLPTNYSFIDPAPLTGINYYRLKESDLDDRFMYSSVRALNFAAANDQKLTWFQAGGTTVEVDLQAGSNEWYSVTDINGRTIQQGQLSSGKLYLSQLPGGMYIVKVTTAAGTSLTTKVFVK